MEGRLTGRRAGHTFAACHEVAGIVGVNPAAMIFWFLPRYDWVDHIVPMLDEVLKEHGLQITGRKMDTYYISTPGHRALAFVRFVSIASYPRWKRWREIILQETRGYREPYIIENSLWENQNGY